LKKRGRPPKPPDDSPDWISYNAALADTIKRFPPAPLAMKKLNDALASGKVRCKIEKEDVAKGELVKRNTRVAVVDIPVEFLEQPWEESRTVLLNDKPQEGWLLLLNSDLIKYFGGGAAPTPAAKTQEKTSAAVGHPLRYDWVEIAIFIERLRQKLSGIRTQRRRFQTTGMPSAERRRSAGGY
jgi:hypothetical protein